MKFKTNKTQDYTLSGLGSVTRVEVIDGATGRVYVNNHTKLHYAQLQDDGRTLKIFINTGEIK